MYKTEIQTKPSSNPDHLLKATPEGPEHHKLPQSIMFITSYGQWTKAAVYTKQGTAT